MKQYLKTLYNKFIEMALGDEPYEESVELANCYLFPAEPESQQSSRRQPATPSIRMQCGAGKSGYTPGKGKYIIKPSAQFLDSCRK